MEVNITHSFCNSDTDHTLSHKLWMDILSYRQYYRVGWTDITYKIEIHFRAQKHHHFENTTATMKEAWNLENVWMQLSKANQCF